MKKLKAMKGHLLISEPSIIGDASFSRSVIYLTEFDHNGAVGFILNKPLDFTLDELIPDFELPLTVYQGGPVETDNLFFLHNKPELIPNSYVISDNVYWGGDFNEVKRLLKDGKISPDHIKFFLGYSGWESEQLYHEVENNSWVVKENELEESLLSPNVHNLWKNQMIDLGGRYEFWSNAPEDPSYN